MVHGQTQPINKPFRLRGTPRYADRIMAAPFHDYCRTASALVLAEDARDETTQTMRAAARAELIARDAARQRALQIQEQLAKLGATPDARRRKEDTPKIKDLRGQLKKARTRHRVNPVSAFRPGR